MSDPLSCNTLRLSHPIVRVAYVRVRCFIWRLSSSREELPIKSDTFTRSMFGSRSVAHRSVVVADFANKCLVVSGVPGQDVELPVIEAQKLLGYVSGLKISSFSYI